MNKQEIIRKINGGLIVSCQALKDEPLYGENIMAKMAIAAKQGGAVGIRANTVKDIRAIKQSVDLPIIGIIKEVYSDSDVYITPTFKEVDALLEEKIEIIAIDATNRKRPNDESLIELIKYIKEKSPNTLIMADASNYEEAINAQNIGFDIVATTLVGYTDYTVGQSVYDNDFEIAKKLVEDLKVPVIIEGKINTPILARKCIEIGALAVVVGGAITRPQQITASFVQGVKEAAI